MKNVSAILTADWHIRHDKPICRTDDFQAAMWEKFEYILRLGAEYKCPILVAGDLGHYDQWPNYQIEKFIFLTHKYNANIIAIAGQHDLPGNNLKQYRKSAIGILSEDKTITLIGIEWCSNHFSPMATEKPFSIFPFPYGYPLINLKLKDYKTSDYPMIAMSHQMVIEDRPLWPGQEDPKANKLLRKFPDYDLILTGDNHLPFVAWYEERFLVNPGSMMRTTVDQADHEPRVYLWDAEENDVEPVHLPIKKDVINREHIDRKSERDERISSYVENLKLKFEIGLDFKVNMTEHLKKTRTRKQVKERIWEACQLKTIS